MSWLNLNLIRESTINEYFKTVKLKPLFISDIVPESDAANLNNRICLNEHCLNEHFFNTIFMNLRKDNKIIRFRIKNGDDRKEVKHVKLAICDAS